MPVKRESGPIPPPGYPRDHAAPRRMRDVESRALAGPLPALPASPTGAPPRLRDLVQRRRGQHHLLRHPRPRYRPLVGRPDQPGLPVHPQAAETAHSREPPHRHRRDAPRVPGRDRAPRDPRSHALDPAAALVQPRRSRRAGQLPPPAPARLPLRGRGPAPRVLPEPARRAATGARTRAGRRRMGDLRHHGPVRQPAGHRGRARGLGAQATPAPPSAGTYLASHRSLYRPG